MAGGSEERPPLIEVARGMGVLLGPSIVLGFLVAAGTRALLRGRVFGRMYGPARLLRLPLGFGAAFPWAYALAIRHWHLRWGATDEEAGKPLPGDDLVPQPGIESTRAITVHAPAGEVWPWLAQIGQDRGGFYSYEWLENLPAPGCAMRTASTPSGSAGRWGRRCSYIPRSERCSSRTRR